MLKNIKAVDDVWFFNSRESLIEKIKIYDPDIMVKGSDYKDRSVVGKELVPKVVYYDRTEHSTTKTIQDIINRG
jgi:bifunctional ADP-heptose synthase (sugar kinase/adenylyltransferase)